ncbi:unnamed protein product [Lepeophtheirus salmonis]|uniref:(salmon louse) hypothetical protein n=1 Tax=Lepeophtheirus salmonis TaxID=72036 RepID=A0A7R8CZR3_LEPSM|nr:unnamed protein product [Lepeophtheirus salmonis]CAF2977460.1 unnamed protein product [Lepeophtheirus salmonis]
MYLAGDSAIHEFLSTWCFSFLATSHIVTFQLGQSGNPLSIIKNLAVAHLRLQMPSKCVVPTCKTSYKDVEQKTISIHKFPKRIKMLETWKSAIQRSYNFNIFEEKSLNFSKLVDGKIEITRPTRIFSAEARRKRSNLLLEALSAGLINRDNINSLVDLKSKIDLKCLPKGVKMEWFDNEVFFYVY